MRTPAKGLVINSWTKTIAESKHLSVGASLSLNNSGHRLAVGEKNEWCLGQMFFVHLLPLDPPSNHLGLIKGRTILLFTVCRALVRPCVNGLIRLTAHGQIPHDARYTVVPELLRFKNLLSCRIWPKKGPCMCKVP